MLESFSVAILRTSDYAHEVIINTNSISELISQEYPQLPSEEKTGYSDFRTAAQLHAFLSPRILIASKSPQRLHLMRQIVAPEKLEVRASELPEVKDPNEHPQNRVKRLAEAKARAVFDQGDFSDSIEFIIGSDTEIYLKDAADSKGWKMIDHPKKVEEAEKALRYLNDNKSHVAVTGIAVFGIDPQTGELKTVVDHMNTIVYFDDLGDHEIARYAASKEPLDRAGAYAIQGLGMQLIKRIDGSYSNVVGLPLELLAKILSEKFDKPIWHFNKVSDWSFPRSIKNVQTSRSMPGES